jgi:hypothetical protein
LLEVVESPHGTGRIKDSTYKIAGIKPELLLQRSITEVTNKGAKIYQACHSLIFSRRCTKIYYGSSNTKQPSHISLWQQYLENCNKEISDVLRTLLRPLHRHKDSISTKQWSKNDMRIHTITCLFHFMTCANGNWRNIHCTNTAIMSTL